MDTPTPKYTVLRFLEINKRTKTTRPCWVKQIAWGDGDRVKKVTFTTRLDEAAHLSSASAFKIAQQYFTYPITLEYHDGTPNIALTAELVQSQAALLQNRNELQRKANAEWRTFWAELVAAVPSLAELFTPSARNRIL